MPNYYTNSTFYYDITLIILYKSIDIYKLNEQIHQVTFMFK